MNAIINRLLKLEALTASSNPHEAALAAEKMAEIMARHSLSMVDIIHARPTSTYADLKRPLGGAIRKWKVWVLMAVARPVGGYVLRHHGQRYSVIAPRDDAEAIWFLYDRIVAQIDRLAAEAWDETGQHSGVDRVHWVSSFCIGCADRVTTRLGELHKRMMQESNDTVSALVVLTDTARDEALKMYPNIRSSRPTSYRYNVAAERAGRQAGDRVSLSQEIGGETRALVGGRS